ncbi:unnamed protein product [Mytilus coruscus]|uniref:EGF-like domain-containing protein n=1 Tax=Mytilus coruscus TaxID=42192 RepID=A0A6J8AWS4_MYTCO|nr:unnamed protein product [Mytilus coruscus]
MKIMMEVLIKFAVFLFSFGQIDTQHHRRENKFCCSGYAHYPNCYPICNGKTLLNDACNEQYTSDKIIYRSGVFSDRGGGTCSSPEYCTGCKDGFYQYLGHCLICPNIANCNHRRCNTPSDNYCEYCMYEIKDKLTWRGYTRHYDGEMKQCKKACSWRADSTRCFPGYCTNEIVETCNCTSGFSGSQCNTITEEPSILYAEIKLHNPAHEIVTTPLDPSDTGPQPVRFTNKNDLNAAEIQFDGKFVASGIPPLHDPSGENHYVTDFKYGIVYGQMTLDYLRAENSTVETYSCPATEDFPITTNYICSRTRVNNSAISMITFSHSDRLVFKIEVRNGGYLKYINRETSTYFTTYLTGKTISRSYTVQWDYITPYYSCYHLFGFNCTIPLIEVLQDVTDQNIISFSWKQWNDDLSGIEGYEYEVFHLHPKGNVLKEDNKLLSSNRIPGNEFQSELNLTTPGMYSLILSAFDRAGNHKSTRSVFLYDNQSVVEKVPGTRIIVTESAVDTNYTWVTIDTNRLTVTWAGRFRNERHDIYKWCNEIEDNSHVDVVYDDRFGQRTVDWLTNVRGVIRFDTNYSVSGPDVKSSEGYTNVPDILQEAKVLDVVWEDGQKLDIGVKATDMMGKYTEDITTVFKDTTAPEITRLWLTYDNKTELYVHRQEDFSSLSFEWDTFDYHSGIYSVHWKLYDNYTGSDVIHGSSHVTAQGDVSNMTFCEDNYQSSPRGPDCYCTLFHGCFHRHFHIQPVIVNGAGLIPGNDKGVHDSDYFIEVTVVNKAMLTSVLTTKITIDTSPPQIGTVHDGLYELPEIDYQQDYHLDFHWDGFFDPESGVKYYKYIIANYCWTKQDLTSSTEGIETYDTVASYDATEEGLYHITVIAMNSANDASNAVCSDGVSITSEKPGVKNVVLDGARTAPRLVTDAGNTIWLIGENLSRSLINDTSLCSAVTTMVEDIQLFPQNENTDIDCIQIPSLDYTFLSVLPRSSKFSLTWDSNISDQLIYDYEIGLSSARINSAPDILPFRSTKLHRHFRINYPDLTEGTIFHIIIKAISKSGVEGIQNFGPIIIDTTPPTFSGLQINFKFEDGTLLANWSKTAFTDGEDPFPLQYMFAIGHDAEGTDVAPYQPLQYNGKCVKTEPPTCTVMDTASLAWSLHENHDYYLTIKVTNLAGLFTTQSSGVYTHNIQLPTAGIVYDIDSGNLNHLPLKDLIDIDFSVAYDILATEWKGFFHPHLQLYYKVCIGSVKGACDIATENNLDASTNQFIFKNLSLSNLQKYYTTVEAVTTTGSIRKSSDGVTMINNKTGLSGIIINDGPLCSDIIVLNASHHVREIVPSCEIDIDYQISTTTLQSKWEVPNNLKHIVRSAYWSIDKRSTVAEVWFKFRDFSYIGSQSHVIVNELDLQPGLTYRFTIKLCADEICFPEISSNGVTVIPSNPVTGSMNVQLDGGKMIVAFAAMYDPDTEDRTEALDAIGTYEWAISDGQYVGGLYEKWNVVNNAMKINKTHINFDIPLSDEIDLSKCKQINVRGINKAGVWSVISGDIKQCNVTVIDGKTEITPSIVIDAFGESDENENNNGIGKDIYLEKDTYWAQTDVDYTPYKNVLSAVWPTLRHPAYQWAVVEVKINNAFTFYKKYTDIVISDPCSHPDMIQCGQTDERYINVQFNKTEYLTHGRSYAVCIHAPETLIEHEKWKETLAAVTTCSDGVMVDLTPPKPGNIWIGHDPQFSFQTTSSDIFITWDSFIDVEEAGYSSHSSGVSRYLVSIGSVVGGVDIVDNKNVRLTNHVTFHDLQLQNGHKYFVTVTAYDFVNRSAEIRSDPITIDTTPPELSSKSITISGRLLSNLTEIEACWEGVFYDVQSGIHYYMGNRITSWSGRRYTIL